MSCSAQGWRTRKLLWAQVACVLECCSRRASVETLSSHESRRTSQGLATRREKPSRSLGVWIVQFDQRDRACDTCCSGLDDDRGASVAFSFIHSGRSFLIALSVITLAFTTLFPFVLLTNLKNTTTDSTNNKQRNTTMKTLCSVSALFMAATGVTTAFVPSRTSVPSFVTTTLTASALSAAPKRFSDNADGVVFVNEKVRSSFSYPQDHHRDRAASDQTNNRPKDNTIPASSL